MQKRVLEQTERHQVVDQPNKAVPEDKLNSNEQIQKPLSGCEDGKLVIPPLVEPDTDQRDQSVCSPLPKIRKQESYGDYIDELKSKSGIRTGSTRAEISPRTIMHDRWKDRVMHLMPDVDVADLPEGQAEGFGYSIANQVRDNIDRAFGVVKNQFAPEFSHEVYQRALEQEVAVGNYFSEKDCRLHI